MSFSAVYLRYVILEIIFFFKQKTAYEMRISDWSSDVCSSDLRRNLVGIALAGLLVGVDDHLALARRQRHRRDLARKGPARDRRLRPLQRFDRIIVLRQPPELIGVGGILRKGAHRPARLIGVLEPVEEHKIGRAT